MHFIERCSRNFYNLSLIVSVSVVTLLFFLGTTQSKALPIYTDALLFGKGNTAQQFDADPRSEHKAAQVARLTGYIKETFKVSHNKTVAIVSEAMYHANQHDLQPELILAVIAVESTFKEKAVSSVGARGLMQIMPRSHPRKVKAIGGVEALFDPKKNIATGVKILHEYLALSKGDLRQALLRYNGSLKLRNPTYAKKVMKVYNKLKRVVESANVS
jgi:soluble lytic murein transglycosylase-like protein